MPREPLDEEEEEDDDDEDDALVRSERADDDTLLRSPWALALADARPSEERDELLRPPAPLDAEGPFPAVDALSLALDVSPALEREDESEVARPVRLSEREFIVLSPSESPSETGGIGCDALTKRERSDVADPPAQPATVRTRADANGRIQRMTNLRHEVQRAPSRGFWTATTTTTPEVQLPRRPPLVFT